MDKLIYSWFANRGGIFSRVAEFLQTQKDTENYIDPHHYDVIEVKSVCLLRGSKNGAVAHVAFEISPQGRPIGAEEYFQSAFQPVSKPDLSRTRPASSAPLPYNQPAVVKQVEWNVAEPSMLAVVVRLTEELEDGITKVLYLAITEKIEYILYKPAIVPV